MELKLNRHDHDRFRKKAAARNACILLIITALLLLCFVISMNTGYSKLSPLDTLRTLFGGGSDKEALILFQLRLPRIIIAILVGAGLALSGCIIQGVARNPLADPGLLGINAGAGLGVVVFILFFGGQSVFAAFTLPLYAMLGAGAAAVLIYVLSYKRQEGIAPIRLILIGLAVQAGITAVMLLLVIKLDDTQFTFVANWQAGNMWGANWRFVLALLPWLAVLFPYVLYQARGLDVLSLGDATAGGLGARVERQRRSLLAAAVALAATCVAISGSISFVGLIAPHLARRLVGPVHRILLPACALAGGVLVLLADTIARGILQSLEVPTGIMVAIIGAPYFMYLLARSKS